MTMDRAELSRMRSERFKKWRDGYAQRLAFLRTLFDKVKGLTVEQVRASNDIDTIEAYTLYIKETKFMKASKLGKALFKLQRLEEKIVERENGIIESLRKP